MFRLPIAALSGGLSLCAPAQAATVVLWPVDPVIRDGQSAAAVWLENKGEEDVVLQIRCLDWRQGRGEDDLSVQDGIVASPPLARVAPGKRQMVRLIRRAPTASPGEQPLRVLVDELPTPVAANAPAVAGARLAVQMRYSIPLFVYGDRSGTLTPNLRFRTVVVEGQRFVEIVNDGGQHARLTDLAAVTPSGTVPLHAGLAGYVLAGAAMRWRLPVDVPFRTLVAGVNGEQQSITPFT